MKNGRLYTIERAKPSQFDDACELAYKVFLKFESKEYGREGTDKFAEFLTSPQLQKLFETGHYIMFLAMCEGDIIGVISVRSGNHISLLFVDERYHRQGIGGELIKQMQDHLLSTGAGYEKMTVNAAPYGIPFYERTGFIKTGETTVTDGIIYTPMEMYL